MALSAFGDKTKPPTDDDLAVTLNSTFVFWNELKRLIASTFSPLSIGWRFCQQENGVGITARAGEANHLLHDPMRRLLHSLFAFGEKAVRAAHETDLPVSVLGVIDITKKYAEGRGARLEVRSAEDVRNVEKLAAVKMAN